MAFGVTDRPVLFTFRGVTERIFFVSGVTGCSFLACLPILALTLSCIVIIRILRECFQPLSYHLVARIPRILLHSK